MNTTITIKNQHGEFSVSAPISETIDELIDLFEVTAKVASWNEDTIKQGFIEKAEELKDNQ